MGDKNPKSINKKKKQAVKKTASNVQPQVEKTK